MHLLLVEIPSSHDARAESSLPKQHELHNVEEQASQAPGPFFWCIWVPVAECPGQGYSVFSAPSGPVAGSACSERPNHHRISQSGKDAPSRWRLSLLATHSPRSVVRSHTSSPLPTLGKGGQQRVALRGPAASNFFTFSL
ncbi:hypothetical protein PWT90_11102 [Aphanocladium album]|nr:hypothetical protein PWT90_11102 [Aphanocladium album]